jgi:hypothetical protein
VLTWIALAGPIAWLVAFEAVYVLAMGCERFTTGAHAVVAATALIAAGAAWIAWRWTPPAVEDETSARTRWLTGAAIGLNIWFAITIAAMEFPIAVVRPCAP